MQTVIVTSQKIVQNGLTSILGRVPIYNYFLDPIYLLEVDSNELSDRAFPLELKFREKHSCFNSKRVTSACPR